MIGYNLTLLGTSDPTVMLLDFGTVLPAKSMEDGHDTHKVVNMYMKVGFPNNNELLQYILRVTLFDIIIGNADRKLNQGNWGFWKSTVDGKVGLCPAYDFNLAQRKDDVVKWNPKDPINYIKSRGYAEQAIHWLNMWRGTVIDFCQKQGTEHWLDNFNHLYKSLSF